MKSKFFRILGVVTSVAMLAGMLMVAPALGLAGVTVTLDTNENTISYANAGYSIGFTLGAAIDAADTITVTFPSATTVAATASVTATISASPGWYGSPPVWTNAIVAGTTYASSATSKTITFTLSGADVIGANSNVYIVVSAGLTNPATAGDYTLSVKTSVETTAVTSAAYTIIVPTLQFPGIVKIYNSAGIQMSQASGATPFAAAFAAFPSAPGWTFELGPGYYTEAALTITDTADEYDGLIIKASGALADTIVNATWTVNADSVTFKGLTMGNNTGTTVVTIGAGADKVTFDGCAFIKSGTATTTVAETFISYGNISALGIGTIKNCSFDTSLGAVQDTNINVTVGALGLTISPNTFKLDNTAAYARDYGVLIASVATPVTIINGNTFTGDGGAGAGVRVDAGTATIQNNTFNTVDNALYATSTSVVVFKGNTVTTCGRVISTVFTTGVAPLYITATSGVTAMNNKITGSKAYVASVAANDANVVIGFNDLAGNTKGILNTANAVNVNAEHNWWGAATGPAAGFNVSVLDATLDKVDANPWLGAAPVNGSFVTNSATLAAQTTAGVDVDLLNAVGGAATVDANDIVGVASYATNPGTVAPSSTLTVKKYFDVYVLDADADAATVLVKFYGTVTSLSEVWFYSTLSGTWTRCSIQNPNSGGGFVAVTINATSTPVIAALNGTPFVLVEAPLAAPAGATIAQTPTLGAVNVPIDTTFTWPAVTGAVSYTFEIAEEIGQTDKFYLKDEIGSSTVNAFKLLDNLKYDTQYWWRVQAVPAVGAKSAWTTSFFTTAKEPVVVVETPPVVIQQNPPAEITLEIPPSPSPVQPIPSYLLWAVIGVGAVLVIAVIVLIVRTRRIS